MSESQKQWLKQILWLLAGIALGALALHFVGMEFTKAKSELHRIQFSTVFFSLVGVAGLVATQGFRFWLLSAYFTDMTFLRCTSAFWMASFLNTVLPARAGDFFRIDFLSKTAQTPRKTILGIFAVDLWLDKVGWLLAVIYLWKFFSFPDWITSRLPIVIALVAVVPSILIYFMWKQFRHSLFKAQRSIGKKRFLISIFIAAPLTWIWEGFIILAVGQSLGFPIDLNKAFIALTAFNVALMVPTPGNVGTFEASGTYALSSLGMSPNDAGTLILIYHALQLAVILVCGGILFAWIGLPLYRPRKEGDKEEADPYENQKPLA